MKRNKMKFRELARTGGVCGDHPHLPGFGRHLRLTGYHEEGGIQYQQEVAALTEALPR